MKLLINLAVIFFTFNGIAKAQNKLSYGIKGGVNFTGYHKSTSAGTTEFGLNLGGIAEYSISKTFSVQAEILYSQKGAKFPVKDNSNPNIIVGNINSKLNYIDIPVLAKIYISQKFSFEIGPQIGFKISNKSKFGGVEIDTDVTTIDTAVVGGFGFEFGVGIFIQARYGYGLSKIFNDEPYKNSVISLSLGYKFN